ncbi:MAG: hypothetical protein H6724_16460 [Sandaracinus sp.]|nr:hypothetical protein [Sandaracinus sp.]
MSGLLVLLFGYLALRACATDGGEARVDDAVASATVEPPTGPVAALVPVAPVEPGATTEQAATSAPRAQGAPVAQLTPTEQVTPTDQVTPTEEGAPFEERPSIELGPIEVAPQPTRPATRLEPHRVKASSEWSSPTSDNRYPAERAFDGDLNTAWNEGVEGPGAGEWLEAELARPALIRRVELVTGWDLRRRGQDLFTANAHVREVILLIDGQEVTRRQVGVDERFVSLEGIDVIGSRVRLVFAQVYAGSRFQDLAIPRVEVWGTE